MHGYQYIGSMVYKPLSILYVTYTLSVQFTNVYSIDSIQFTNVYTAFFRVYYSGTHYSDVVVYYHHTWWCYTNCLSQIMCSYKFHLLIFIIILNEQKKIIKNLISATYVCAYKLCINKNHRTISLLMILDT